MVSPKQKKRVVKAAAEKGLCSLRRACAYLSLSWSTFSYRPKQASEKAQRLVERIVSLSWKHPRYGYRRIRALLVKEGWTTSRKFVQAVRRSEGLQVKPPKKRRHCQGVSTGPPTKTNGLAITSARRKNGNLANTTMGNFRLDYFQSFVVLVLKLSHYENMPMQDGLRSKSVAT